MIKNISYTIFFIFISIILSPFSYSLEKLSDSKMKNITGQKAFTRFSVINNTTRIFLNTHIETFTEIDSVKIGYYDRQNHGLGWDQDWTDLSFGTDTSQTLKIDGLIIKADFDDLNAANPNLKRLIIGSNHLNGTISGNFNSFTGAYKPEVAGEPPSTPVRRIRENISNKNFTFDSATENQGFFIILSPEGPKSGIHTLIGYGEDNVNNSFSPDEWWDSP
ncbi:MAG: hypothetical protein CSA18_04320 [Deltaproteobacteria bacterium]|nr:MAG: hypothetical protein CSA18_04320 [Deltaproteobacteria bacterium]